MPTRSRTMPQEPVEAPPLAIASLVDGRWLCGNEWFTGVIRKEDEHAKVGHRWFVKLNDGDDGWLEDKYVRRHAKASSSSNQVASPPVVSRAKKNTAAKSKAVRDAGDAPAKKKPKKPVPVETAAEVEEEEEVVKEKLQEEPMKKAEPPSPEKVLLEKKPIVPFLMGGQGFVALQCQVKWALRIRWWIRRYFKAADKVTKGVPNKRHSECTVPRSLGSVSPPLCVAFSLGATR